MESLIETDLQHGIPLRATQRSSRIGGRWRGCAVSPAGQAPAGFSATAHGIDSMLYFIYIFKRYVE